jgi:hypothetical protein
MERGFAAPSRFNGIELTQRIEPVFAERSDVALWTVDPQARPSPLNPGAEAQTSLSHS